jgi:DNA invertase Pin-like site-specific DNA recombinase
MPKRRGGEAQRAPNRACVADEQIRCYELRLTGMSIEKIATATGIPRSTVHDPSPPRSTLGSYP